VTGDILILAGDIGYLGGDANYTQCVSNQLGYVFHEEHASFDPGKYIEVKHPMNYYPHKSEEVLAAHDDEDLKNVCDY